MTTIIEIATQMEHVKCFLSTSFDEPQAARLHTLEETMFDLKPASIGEIIAQLTFLADYLLETDGDHPGEAMLRHVIDRLGSIRGQDL